MINENLLKTGTSLLFTESITVKASIIISESESEELRCDQDKFIIYSPHQMMQMKDQIFVSTIKYPTYSFLARKLKRILLGHLQKAFTNLRLHRPPKPILNLLESRNTTLVGCALGKMKEYALVRKLEIQQADRQRRKQAGLVFYAIDRRCKNKFKVVFQRLKIIQMRYNRVFQFVGILHTILQVHQRRYLSRLLMRALSTQANKIAKQCLAAANIMLLLPRIPPVIKSGCFYEMVLYTQNKQMEKMNEVKKQVSLKYSRNTSQKNKALNLHRDCIKELKNDLDNYSANRSKARAEIKQNIAAQKNKLKEDEKKAKITISGITIQIQNLTQQLQAVRELLTRRRDRLVDGPGQAGILELYRHINEWQPDQKPNWLPKQSLGEIEVKLDRLDEYQARRNQKLRELVCEYEGITVHTGARWPEEERIEEQNQVLKELIGCLVGRGLERKNCEIYSSIPTGNHSTS